MAASDRKVSLNRSPLAAGLGDARLVRLSRASQRRLGCAVNEDVFLECPYAFVPRRELSDLARQADSPLRPLAEEIAACAAQDVLLGYASDKIVADESGEFAVYLTEEARRAVVQRNRAISRELRRLVREEIGKPAGRWRELGSAAELERGFVRAARPLREVELALPVAELRRRRTLGDRSAGGARDGYVELTPLHEDFENVRLAVVARATQTHLPSAHAEAQTYPGHPKNQWTQYEYEIDPGILETWSGKLAEKEENGDANVKENSSEIREEEEISEEELQLRAARRKAWEKLNDFLKSRAPDVIDAVSFNATTNLYTNDVVNLAGCDQVAAFSQPYRDYEERMSLIDLKTVGEMHLLAASWHCDLDDVIACTYLSKESKGSSLVALWSLLSPLRPKFLLDCEERLSMLSFCPLAGYTNVLVGGCLDGKIIVWEVNRQFFDESTEEKMDSFAYESKEPELKECKIAMSAEKSQRGSITGLQWLPSWCRIEPDGNYHRASGDSPRERRAQFATASADGSVFFWSLPRALSRAAQARSPLHLTASPVYQLRLEEPAAALTGLCLPLAGSEESSTPSIREQADLERLRRVFLATSLGEVLCCGWEGQTFSVDVTDRETCSVLARYCAHDGLVRAMLRSPHLDDVFLTVGGSRFALWKEDFSEAPIFQRASPSGSRYADACWSLGRPGTFLLARLDGFLELWDLKRRADEPVLLQTVSGKSAQLVIPSPVSSRQRLLAVLDGASTVRVLAEPRGVNDEDLERLEWCEEFAWRETKRKLDFRRWQEEYLRAHPTALRRKAEREQAEANRRHREARERFLKVFGIICMACSSPTHGTGGWFVFVSVTAFIMTLIWCILYMFSIREALKLPINWILTELINTGIYTVLYFTAFVTQLAWASWTSHIVAGVFGIFNTIAYGAGTYFLYLEHKNGQQ